MLKKRKRKQIYPMIKNRIIITDQDLVDKEDDKLFFIEETWKLKKRKDEKISKRGRPRKLSFKKDL